EGAGHKAPNGIPVRIELPFIRTLQIRSATQRIRLEEDGIAPVAKRVERELDGVALPDVVAVAAHLVGDPTTGLALPRAKGHIDVVLVVEDPHFSLLAARLSGLRLHLNEA